LAKLPLQAATASSDIETTRKLLAALPPEIKAALGELVKDLGAYGESLQQAAAMKQTLVDQQANSSAAIESTYRSATRTLALLMILLLVVGALLGART